MGNQILFVDDEKPILKALERLFFDSGYEVMTADGGEAGLKLLAERPADVVVSDVRMPGMDGHQFLREVRSRHPGTTRLILSGYLEEKAVLGSIVDGSSTMYLPKPWDGHDLKEKIARIFAAREIFTSKALLDYANRLENLSVVPGIYPAVCKLIEQGANMERIAEELETDPTVAAAVLRVANSAFNAVKTGSLVKAVTFLGLATIKTIVFSCSLFKLAGAGIPSFSTKQLSLHAATANRLYTLIYGELLRKPLPQIQQTACLLSNIGLLTCMHYFPDKYGPIVRDYAGGRGKSLAELERALLGITHAEMGGYLLNWWGLPYPIVEAALFHHTPLHPAVINKEAVAAASIANYYAGLSMDYRHGAKPEQAVFARLGIRQEDCATLLKR